MVLRLEAVDKRFGKFEALKGVSIHVRRGDCYGFLGHNGAGKTTALRIALGLIPSDGGRVIVDGFDAARHPREARARQGGLIETPGFYPWLSGRRNLLLLAHLEGLDRRAAAKEAGDLLDTVGLSHAADRPVGGYSQGMRQRLGIAQALLGGPPLLLLDEPMNGLDPEGIDEFRRLIVRLVREEGRTVLLSSHQINEVSDICNRIGILRQGELIVEAKTKELLATGDQRYRLRTENDDAARRLFEEQGIKIETAPDGALSIDPEECPPGQVAAALVEKGISLEELAPRPVSLEAIYLRFSRGEASAARPRTEERITVTKPKERIAPRWPAFRALVMENRLLSSHCAPLLILLLPALLAVFSILRQWARAAGHMRQLESGELFSHSLVTAFEGAAVALGTALPLAAFVVAGLASQSIAGDFSRGTLRNILLQPVGRIPLALGKAAGVVCAVIICYFLLVLAAVAGANLAFDFTDVVEIMEIRTAEPWVRVEAKVLWPLFLKTIPALALPLIAYGALGFLAGAIVSRSVPALSLAAGFVVFLDLFRTVGREFGFEHILLSAYLPSPLGDTSLIGNLLDRIRAPNDPPGGYVDGAVWIPLAWLTVSILLASLILKRRSVP